ncbi:liver-expressed antimicrobial peptide 2-like isoform X1 [Ictalurus furcatus]|uniref:liver-expressed antimicrobial peptide 2-like isoform X1 n=1 Tax=Ictalurus furcatus TaxID=66913 RepID=UPI00234FDC74|nr:liver-expressed antimicrobial peptide 2-like isoform X1 [Ictalurus furcatus]
MGSGSRLANRLGSCYYCNKSFISFCQQKPRDSDVLNFAEDDSTAYVEAAPVVDTWASGLIHRAKRSLLWRWNTLKPVGAGCRDNYECGTNYCRRNICTFQPTSSSS